MEAEAAEEEEVEEAGYKIKNKNPTQNKKNCWKQPTSCLNSDLAIAKTKRRQSGHHINFGSQSGIYIGFNDLHTLPCASVKLTTGTL